MVSIILLVVLLGVAIWLGIRMVRGNKEEES
jgi:hypothetical protein